MILALSYSRRDERQALKLMRWIGFLASQQRSPISKRMQILLVPSKSCADGPWHKEIAKCAASIFGRVITNIPEVSYEEGWPKSPNFMFRHVLKAAELLREDFFFIEPDAIPVHEDWLNFIVHEYKKRKTESKPFMGAYVNLPNTNPMIINTPHMTGIACYPHNWREMAPSLAAATDIAWDVFSAPQVLSRANWTNLIQHIFYNPEIKDLSIVSPEAVIFHQDKQGKLIEIIDAECFYGACRKSKWTYELPELPEPMKYFRTPNATRPIRRGGMTFLFESVYQHAGSWTGVYATADSAEIDQLNALVGNPQSGIYEITEAEYQAELKKKAGGHMGDPNPLVRSNPQPKEPKPVPAASLAAAEPEKPVFNITTLADVVKTAKIEPNDSAKMAKQKRPRQSAVK